jgi:hypothetical protein
MNPTQLVRGICGTLSLVTAGVAVCLMLRREASLSIKVAWIAAMFTAIALAPEKLPFLSDHARACLLFRNAFGAVFAILALLILFVVFWIQLPKERVPRFDGKVLKLVNLHGLIIPRIDFQDSEGKQVIFDDALATVIFPKHSFIVGEHVIVRAPADTPPHVDHCALARWGTILFLVLVAVTTLSLSLAYHLRYLSLGLRGNPS